MNKARELRPKDGKNARAREINSQTPACTGVGCSVGAERKNNTGRKRSETKIDAARAARRAQSRGKRGNAVAAAAVRPLLHGYMEGEEGAAYIVRRRLYNECGGIKTREFHRRDNSSRARAYMPVCTGFF